MNIFWHKDQKLLVMLEKYYSKKKTFVHSLLKEKHKKYLTMKKYFLNKIFIVFKNYKCSNFHIF